MPDMWVDKFIRNPLWATLVGALVAAMGVSVVVFVHSGEAAPQAADEHTPYASASLKSPMIVGGTAVPNGKYSFMAALLDKGRPGDAFDELFCRGPFDIRTFRMHEGSVPVCSDSRAKRAYKSQGLKYVPSLQVAVGKKGNG